MINLIGHAWKSLANHSGFKKSDTLVAKQELVHVIGKGSMHSATLGRVYKRLIENDAKHTRLIDRVWVEFSR
jgi:hypothetical protein